MHNTLILNPPISILRFFTLKWRFSLRAFWFLSCILIASLLIFCVYQVVFLVKETYYINDYEKNLNKIAQENKMLEISLLQQSSIKNLESYVRVLDFEPVQDVHYIRILEGQVVTK